MRRRTTSSRKVSPRLATSGRRKQASRKGQSMPAYSAVPRRRPSDGGPAGSGGERRGIALPLGVPGLEHQHVPQRILVVVAAREVLPPGLADRGGREEALGREAPFGQQVLR